MKKWLGYISDYIVLIFGLKIKNLTNLETIKNKELVKLLSELALLLVWTFSLVITFLGKQFLKINNKLDYLVKHNRSIEDYKEFI